MNKVFFQLNFVMVIIITCLLCLSCRNSDSKSDYNQSDQKQYSELLAKRAEEKRLEEEKQKLEAQLEEERRKAEEQRLEEEKRKEEEMRKKTYGPDWIQGTWSANMYDKSSGNYLGTLRYVIKKGNLDMYVNGKFFLSLPYVYDGEREVLSFVNSDGQLTGRTYVRERDKCLVGDDGTVFKKIQ